MSRVRDSGDYSKLRKSELWQDFRTEEAKRYWAAKTLNNEDPCIVEEKNTDSAF